VVRYAPSCYKYMFSGHVEVQARTIGVVPRWSIDEMHIQEIDNLQAGEFTQRYDRKDAFCISRSEVSGIYSSPPSRPRVTFPSSPSSEAPSRPNNIVWTPTVTVADPLPSPEAPVRDQHVSYTHHVHSCLAFSSRVLFIHKLSSSSSSILGA
jgi:hypothetical protein